MKGTPLDKGKSRAKLRGSSFLKRNRMFRRRVSQCIRDEASARVLKPQQMD